jgi:opine dehydrogenase
MKTFCVCGGGSMGHVISAWLSAKSNLEVNVLTSKPHLWHEVITISTPNGKTVKGKLSKISSDPADVIPQSDVVLLCLPGFIIREKLCEIKPYLNEKAYVGSVFSSSGFVMLLLSIIFLTFRYEGKAQTIRQKDRWGKKVAFIEGKTLKAEDRWGEKVILF